MFIIFFILLLNLQQNTFEQGMYLFNAGFYKESIEKLDDSENNNFIKGIAYFRIKDFNNSVQYFEKIDIQKYYFLKNEIYYYLSNNFFNTENYEKANEYLEKIDETFILQKEKDILAIKIYLKLKKWDKLNDYYDKYKDLKVDSSSDMEIKFPLAVFKAENKKSKFKPTNKDESIKILKEIFINNPNSEIMTELNLFEQTYEFSLYDLLDNSEKTQKCSNLVILHQNKEGTDCFDKFIENLTYKDDENTYCDAQFYYGVASKKRRNHKIALTYFDNVITNCKKYKNLDKTYYNALSSALAKKDFKASINYSEYLYKNFKDSPLADDGINNIGFIYSLQKKYKQAEKIYLEQLKLFPSGDTTEEAIWRVAYNYYKQKKYKEYIKFYSKITKESYNQNHYYSKGRIEYFLAKSYEKLEDNTKSQDIYKSIIENYSNNFYVFLARMKYKEKLKESKIENDEITDIELKNLFKTEGLNEKIEYLTKNYLTEFLMYELNQLNKKHQIYEKYKKELLVFLMNAKSYYIPFWQIRGNYKWISYDIPFNSNVNLLKNLYPLAFIEYVNKFSKQYNISKYLVLSIMREESYFHSSIESWANAFGLMQIIEPTAKDLAKSLKLEYNKEFLFNPEYNIKLGSKYLSNSSKTFDGLLYKIIPSYNAGVGAVKNWEKMFKDVEFDEFIEEITYDETRLYVKRVLNTYFMYNLLYEKKYVILE